jgi:hypothetical protein
MGKVTRLQPDVPIQFVRCGPPALARFARLAKVLERAADLRIRTENAVASKNAVVPGVAGQ